MLNLSATGISSELVYREARKVEENYKVDEVLKGSREEKKGKRQNDRRGGLKYTTIEG